MSFVKLKLVLTLSFSLPLPTVVQPEPEPERKNSISEKKSSSPNHNAGKSRNNFIKGWIKILNLVFNSEGEDNGPRDVPGREMWKMRRKKKKGKI